MENNLEILVQRFIEASIKLEESTLAGDSERINKESKEIMIIVKELRGIGKDAMDKLLPLLSHENNYVRCNAACCIIPVYPKKARETLTEISQLKGLKAGMIGFNAMMTLREWGKGNLKFD